MLQVLVNIMKKVSRFFVGFDQSTLDSLPFAYTLLLYEVIYHCQANANTRWPSSALTLIKRYCFCTDRALMDYCNFEI